MSKRPTIEKLGYTAQPAVLKFISADQRLAVAEMMVMQVLFYYGSLVEYANNKISIETDYPQILDNITKSLQLDPYNMDAYYFAQAVLTWDSGHVTEVNKLLEYGMGYRTWDFYLPFFAGFNAAYFLKDYEAAARYYQRAADITGDELFTRLASRYMYESGRTDHAIAYLKSMINTSRNDDMRRSYEQRLLAFLGVRKIEQALASYRATGNTGHVTVKQLHATGFLDSVPPDPYGGEFFVDDQGVVRSTSKFAPLVPTKPAQGVQ